MAVRELNIYLQEKLIELARDPQVRAFLKSLALTLNYLAEQTASLDRKLVTARFSDKEREILIRNGAVIYSLAGETIAAQLKIQKMMGRRLFWSVCDGLDERPSVNSEVAIFPKDFFIPDTGGKILEDQENLVAKDAEDLRGGLGLSGIDEIVPDAAVTLTGVAIEHFIRTGVWLFGPDYGLHYGITKNSTNRSGCVAIVGRASPVTGLEVSEMYPSDSRYDVRAVRLVVPRVDR